MQMEEVLGEQLRKTIKHGMTDAGVRSIRELAKKSGIEYRTLLRRMEAPHAFTVLELYLIGQVIELEEWPV